MGRPLKEWDDIRLACYREGRLLLMSAGYEQVSMRMFRLSTLGSRHEPVYCCQDDGMLGLGCGARSYTQGMHYSSEYAVGASGVREIIANFIETPRAAFNFAEYGFVLSPDEQRRRFVIKSILQTDGLVLDAFRERFGRDAQEELPQLKGLLSA